MPRNSWFIYRPDGSFLTSFYTRAHADEYMKFLHMVDPDVAYSLRSV
jgi:hypothetical protein